MGGGLGPVGTECSPGAQVTLPRSLGPQGSAARDRFPAGLSLYNSVPPPAMGGMPLEALGKFSPQGKDLRDSSASLEINLNEPARGRRIQVPTSGPS